MQVDFGNSAYGKIKCILSGSFARGAYRAYYLGDNKTLVFGRWGI